MGQGQFYRATSAALEHRSIGGRGTNREQAALQLFRLRGDCFWHHRRKVSIMSHERVPSFSVFKLFEGFSLSLAYLASPLAYLFGVGAYLTGSQKGQLVPAGTVVSGPRLRFH